MTEPGHKTELDYVFVAHTTLTELHGWFYVGADTETEARRLIQAARPDQIVQAVKRVKNVEHVKKDEVRSLGVGDPYTGPLIPQ